MERIKPHSDYHGHVTMNNGTHKVLTDDEAKAIWQSAERAAEDRAKLMPTSDDAMRAILDAQQRMGALGWRKGLGLTGVKRGDVCAIREDGSTGIWSGWIDQEGKYAHYCDGVSELRKVWIKPTADLTDDEFIKMQECDEAEAEFAEAEFSNRIIRSLIQQDK